MARRFLVGIDDTDYGESIGTGALARELQIRLMLRLGLASRVITRHQFLVHPDIPYTSHNSSACIELEGESSVGEIAAECVGFIGFLHHPGADPGLCVATPDQLTPACAAFGARAQTEVVRKEEAVRLAAEHGIHLQELGGEGIGIIGALGGCALRASGRDGRFISMRGIRELEGELTVSEILARTEIDRVVDPAGNALAGPSLVDTAAGVRPVLVDSRVVLPVVPTGNGAHRVEKRNKKDDR